jgi:hypothetical protein
MKNKMEHIQIIKVENGFVVVAGGKSFISMDEDGVKEIVDGEMPGVFEALNKQEVIKDAGPEPTTEATTGNEVPNAGRTRHENPDV